MRRAKKLITNLDAFGQPSLLAFNGNTYHTTSFGGLMTLIIGIIMIVSSLKSFENLFSRQNGTITSTTDYNLDPTLLNLSNTDFMFSIGTNIPDYGLDNSLFQYSATLMTIDSNNNRSSINIPMVQCNASYYSSSLSTYYEKFGLNNMLCPKYINSTFMQGSYGNDNFTLIELAANLCNTSDSTVTCAPSQTINDYFINNTKVRINIYFTNSVTNPSNYSNPITNFIQTESWLVTPDSFVNSDLYFQNVSLQTDDNILGMNSNPKQEYIITYNQEMQTQSIYLNTPQLLQVNLRSSYFSQTLTRNYASIITVLSTLGGLWSVLRLIIGTLAVYANAKAAHMKMANLLFQFDGNDDGDPNDVDNQGEDFNQQQQQQQQQQGDPNPYHQIIAMSVPSPNIPNPNKQLNKFPTSENFEYSRVRESRGKPVLKKAVSSLNVMNMRPTTKEIVMSTLKRNFTGRKSLRFSRGNYCMRIFSYLCSFFTYNKLYKAAEKRLLYETDICSILRKIHQSDRLKHVVLNNDQLSLFNFNAPPIVRLRDYDYYSNKINNHKSRDYILRKYIDIDEYYTRYNVYTKLKRQISNPQFNQINQFNQNLLNIIDKDTLDIFETIRKEQNGLY